MEYQFRHEKCVQDNLVFKQSRVSSLVRVATSLWVWNWGWQILLFKASRKADAEAAIPLYVSGSEDYSLSGVWNGWEMIRIWILVILAEKKKPCPPRTMLGTVEQATKPTARTRCAMSRKGSAPGVSPFTNGKGLGIADDWLARIRDRQGKR